MGTTIIATTPNSVNGKWNEQKTKLKAKFTTLTDSDLNCVDGKNEEMLGKVSTKIGKTKDELTQIISAL